MIIEFIQLEMISQKDSENCHMALIDNDNLEMKIPWTNRYLCAVNINRF